MNSYEADAAARLKQDAAKMGLVIALLVVLALGWVVWLFVGPTYTVWARGMEGKARLMQAEQERRILVTQALAEKDAATLRAEAIAIVGKATQDFPEYRQQELMGAFGEALREGHVSQVIYVPTEANLPILEAGRRK